MIILGSWFCFLASKEIGRVTGKSTILVSNPPKTKEERKDEDRDWLVGDMLEFPPPDTPWMRRWLNDKMIVLLSNGKGTVVLR